MKLLASLLIAVSLVIGVTGAMTAYLVPLTLSDERLIGLTLNANAGIDPADEAGKRPLVMRGDLLTAARLETLRQQQVVRIDVKEFVLWGWIRGWGLPLFLVGSIGLVGGAVLLRKANRAALQGAGTGIGAARATAAQLDPAIPFDAIRAGIQRLKQELPQEPDVSRKHHLIMDILGEAQRTHIPAFVATRPQLIARLGLGGYAQLMDSFAAAERQLNRAWSAAADGVLDEALDRVETAGMLLDEAAAKLK